MMLLADRPRSAAAASTSGKHYPCFPVNLRAPSYCRTTQQPYALRFFPSYSARQQVKLLAASGKDTGKVEEMDEEPPSWAPGSARPGPMPDDIVYDPRPPLEMWDTFPDSREIPDEVGEYAEKLEEKQEQAETYSEWAQELESGVPRDVMKTIPIQEADLRELRGNPDEIVPFEGYTPKEMIDFEDTQLHHEHHILVEATPEKCYLLWEDRLNYLEWFDKIHRMTFDPDDNTLAELYCYYQWGETPPLELYLLLQRVASVPGRLIQERSIQGMPLNAAVKFSPGEEPGTTLLDFSFSYAIPSVMADYVGPVGLFGDVDEILEEAMCNFAHYAAHVDLEELLKIRKEDREYYNRGESPPGSDQPHPLRDVWLEEFADKYPEYHEYAQRQGQQGGGSTPG